MTLRRLFPYAIIIVLFAGFYWLTMMMPVSWVEKNIYRAGYIGKIAVQRDIFVLGLPALLVTINILEILTVNRNTFLSRLLKSTSTILLCFLASLGVYYLLGQPRVANLFEQRISPHFVCFMAVVCTILPLIGLELIQRVLFTFTDKSNIARYIPRWLSMHDTPERRELAP